MTVVKFIFLLILITVMDHHGFLYRTDTDAGEDEIESGSAEYYALAGKNNLKGTWRLTGVSETPNEHGNTFTPEKQKEEFLLSFFPDSTYTQVTNDGRYVSGKWVFDEDSESVFLTSNRKTEEVKVLFDLASTGKRLATLVFSPENSMSLAEYGRSLDKYKEDPYYAANNQWRIKPTESENEKQIHERLTNYIAHNLCILKSAQIREQDYISWEFSEGIIKLYNVGIGIVSIEKIPQSWIDNFYSREDALRAHEIFETYLRTGTHKKFATGNWVKDDYNILLGIQNGLTKMNNL
ncbi:hypothetical protein FEM33_24285 [Dyadobacter flavalbus]|uniref:Uncharacterized protein n=1 Tax=Dyadobacter flavalbus TaxID=2579942 RepID=A0A5M8Q996_9BACT|nr:hypothetical protein [Dyadobacter flavalbus]KAA6431436.1 hypothetical protein FEM33_24285 [Dyadobacter flavalbus]